MMNPTNSEIKLAAGIVLYYPDNRNRFVNVLQSVLRQVSRVYIFDNSTQPLDFIIPKEVVYLTEHKNMGIAYALNRIMEAAKADGFAWVITLDQDSLLPDKAVDFYVRAIKEETNLGIVCPQVVDERRAYMEIKRDPKREYIDMCITSGGGYECRGMGKGRPV